MNQKQPKVSVIMPVYNTKEEYLREAIESILNQTFADFEFIIINDGSTNNVEDVILSYKDERIKYFYKENSGIADSLNYGISKATGGLIARMDSDDISFPERFAKQVSFLEQNPNISVVGTWFKMFPKERVIYHPTIPKFLDFLKECSIGHPTVMFRKYDFEKYDLKYNPDYTCEDYELWSRAIQFLDFANIPEVLLQYRSHTSTLTHTKQQQIATDDHKVRQNMLNFLTADKEVQKQIMQICCEQQNKGSALLENLFSIKLNKSKSHKIITILGLKLKFKRNFQCLK